MGLNFYAIIPESSPCDHCGRYDVAEKLHIGKSSAGWHFSLHVIPERGLTSLDAWETYLKQPNVIIEDEDHAVWGRQELMDRITKRHRPDPLEWTQKMLDANHAEPGIGNLVRHKLGNHCVGHGEGTWDYIVGEFS